MDRDQALKICNDHGLFLREDNPNLQAVARTILEAKEAEKNRVKLRFSLILEEAEKVYFFKSAKDVLSFIFLELLEI